MHFESNEHRTEYLRQVLATPGALLKFTRQVRDRMYERQISELDIRSCLGIGSVVDFRVDERGETWRVRGETCDGDTLYTVVAPVGSGLRIVLVTVFRP